MTREKVELFQIGWHMDGFEKEERTLQNNTCDYMRKMILGSSITILRVDQG